MNELKTKKRFTFKGGLLGLVLSLIVSPQLMSAINVAQSPLFLTQAVKPLVMLNISNDHQLYFKAFDDYSDLDNDGAPETTYKHSVNYYGYFDSGKCYDYNNSNSRYVPVSITADKYCSGNWSGNFLNWASMSRMDTIRKMLYGGLRSTDTAVLTVLERAFIPSDAHSFAKFYGGSDIDKLTPFSAASNGISSGSGLGDGITLCNTTVSSSGTRLSQDVTSPPLLRVAKGNFTLWASHERFQCQWRGTRDINNGIQDTSNGNNAGISGLNASEFFPEISAHRLDEGSGDYIVRVEVCKNLPGDQEDCKDYGTSTKPIGILQTYGDDDKIRFGLMTGSYRKHISGGVLRKNIGTITDEINSVDGTFKALAATDDGIIKTLNSLRIYGYQYTTISGNLFREGNYFDTPPDDAGTDKCSFSVENLTDLTNEECSNWGNPQSEIYLESLRYLAGKAATSDFEIDDSSRIATLTTATFSDPIAATQHCAPINVIQFNASTSSYDADELAGAADLGLLDLDAATDVIGTGEGLSGEYFVGENGVDINQLCTAKTVTNLSSVRGTCPDAPRLQGSYHIAGLAHFAHTNDIRSDREGDQFVTTYGIALTPSIPKAVVPVPGTTKTVTILPACQNIKENGNCTLVDYKIVSQNHSANPATGKLYVNWEAAEQGGDFDQDMWGILDYSVTSTQVTITTRVLKKSTSRPMGFGYIINGTTKDGFHAHSGISKQDPPLSGNIIDSYIYNDPTNILSCNGCTIADGASSVIYQIGTSSAASLEQPLFYAAKYGGFIDSNDNNMPDLVSEWDANNPPDGLPDRYFFAINPQKIAESLASALDTVLKEPSSSASVATNSTRIDTNTVIFQAKFSSIDWTGQVFAFLISPDGSLASDPSWDAGEILTTQTILNRNVFAYNTSSKSGVAFDHGNLSATQQLVITANQVEYLKGDQSNEASQGGTLRDRDGPNWLLGDVINSDPWYIGKQNLGFHLIPPPAGTENTTEADSYLTFRSSSVYQARTPLLAIGSNDGMLHVFNGTIGNTDSGKEVFAFVPDTVLPGLLRYTNPIYPSAGQHRYYVDGSPISSDVYIDAGGSSDKEWRTVLVGTTGAGGKGIFALDVSFMDPTDSTYETAESAFTSNQILWEISSTTAPNIIVDDLTDDTTDLDPRKHRFGFTKHMGLTIGKPSIVRMANGKFAAVIGNGYGSINNQAVLYIIDIETGKLIKSINTHAGSVGSPNGLSSPITIDVNGDRVIDAIYAGDLLGNLWKFDVSSSDPLEWVTAFGTPAIPAPLYVAKDSANMTQAITGKPQVGSHPKGGVMVYFGTGQYFETGDNLVGVTPQVHTFYGIRDDCVPIAGVVTSCNTTSSVADRSQLQPQTIDAEGTITTTAQNGDVIASFGVRQTSDHTVDFSAKEGWYMDLVNPPQPGTKVGERVVTFPLLRSGRIIFVTLLPENEECSAGGSSWLMELDALNGKRLGETPFDLTGDGIIDTNDLIAILDTNGDGTIDASDAVNASGKKSNVGIIKTPGVIGAGEVEFKYTSGSKGIIEKTTESAAGGSGRLSWIQLR